MIEVFTTNVHQQHQASTLEGILQQHFPLLKIDFDIEDCDKILRVEGHSLQPAKIIELLSAHGFTCRVME